MAVGRLSLLLTTVSWMFCSGLEERLVLHSDTDIAQEITEMKTLLARQNQSIQSLTHAMGEKDAKIAHLEANAATRDHEIAQLKSNTATRDGEIAQLKSNATIRDHELAQLKTKLQTNEQEMKSGHKSTYVRWGKTSCPGNGSTLVYSGYMAGGQYAQKGSGSNYLCLADKPHWNYYVTENENGGIRGVEYSFGYHSATEIAKFFGSNIQGDDAPCAVCETSRAANIMIPGTDVCYGGWTKEYSGYIVSGFSNEEHENEFVCLDARPDSIPGSHTSDSNARLYISEVDCGSSSLCPPYMQGRELTCVVCSV